MGNSLSSETARASSYERVLFANGADDSFFFCFLFFSQHFLRLISSVDFLAILFLSSVFSYFSLHCFNRNS